MWSKVLSSVPLIVPFGILYGFIFFPNEPWAKVPFLVLLEIVAVFIGGICVLAVFRPGFRGHWKGTKVATGAVTNAGAAMGFLSMALAFAQSAFFPRSRSPSVVFAILLGFALVALGSALDRRAYDRRPRKAQPGLPENRFYESADEWLAVLAVVAGAIAVWFVFVDG